MEERRGHNRFAFLRKISYHLYPLADKEIHTGTIVNLSRSGLCLSVQNPLIVGQKITVKIKETGFNGTVVWCSAGEESETYQVGVEF